jgi:hypothetical protein
MKSCPDAAACFLPSLSHTCMSVKEERASERGSAQPCCAMCCRKAVWEVCREGSCGCRPISAAHGVCRCVSVCVCVCKQVLSPFSPLNFSFQRTVKAGTNLVVCLFVSSVCTQCLPFQVRNPIPNHFPPLSPYNFTLVTIPDMFTYKQRST